MNSRRAEEILHSKDKIDVELNGQFVWIESVDLENELVQVHPEGNPNERFVVEASQLREVD